MEEQVLSFLNEKIRDEHGNRVTMDSMWIDADLDSFGTVMVIADMDNEYECFPKEWMQTTTFRSYVDEDGVEHKGISIREVVEKVLNESPKL